MQAKTILSFDSIVVCSIMIYNSADYSRVSKLKVQWYNICFIVSIVVHFLIIKIPSIS